MHTKKRLTSLIASILAAIMFLSIFNVAISSIPVSAADAGEDYLIKYAKDDDTFYFATETRDVSQGIIVSPLGYFCSFYNATTGELCGTVFVTDTTWGRAYYDKNADTYKYRIKRADIESRMQAELAPETVSEIRNLQSKNKIRFVFDTLLSIAYIKDGTLYPSMTLSKINPTAGEVWNAISAYNNLGGNFNQGDSTGLFVYTNYGNMVGGAYPAYAKSCSMIYVSSATHQTENRKRACLGENWDVSFSKSLYDNFYWTRADSGDSYIQKVFSETSKASIPPGYFAVPTPPDSVIIEDPTPTIDVDLYPTGVTWLDSNGNETYYLVEGRTYTPVFHFYNAGSVGVYARVSSWSFPYWKDVLYDDWGNASTQIYIGADSGYSIQSREPITITQGLYYGDGVAYEGYELNVDTIKHKLTIALDCTDGYDASGNYVYVQESNTGNNQQTYTNWFSPKEPSLSQWVVDQENSNSNWIHDDSIYGQWKLYSGEQVNSYLWIQNNSSFNINIIDKFKAILGLDNNLLQESNDLRYFSANGKEGDNWTRTSGIYRVKNTNKNTHKTLYLTDTAAEKSYAEGAGVNIADLTTIANNVTLNRQQFFSSGSYDGGNGNTCSREWDNDSRILTLNGVDSIGFWNNTFDYTFKPWTRYRVTVEYVSGSVSLNNGAYYACLAFQGANEEGGRVYADIKFPNCSKQGTSSVCTGFVDTDGRTQYTFRPWIYIQAGGQLTFNNYKVKVKIEEVSVTDWDMSYTRHIQGYSVVPTDLEASALNLYDADTGERIKEGTVLKAGQKVYSETTYTNYTETPVAATFQTKHNNNNNTEYYIADNASMASSVKSETPIKDMANLFENKTVRNSKGQTITQSWDGESRTLTLNGSGTANFEPIASVAAEFKEGNTYRVTLEYVSGTLIGAKNTEVPSSGLFFTAAGNSGSDRRIFVDVDYPKFNAKNSNTCTGEFTMLRDSGSLYVGIFFNDKSTLIAYNNYKIRVNIEKVSPKVSWNSDSKTLSVSGTYDRNRVFSEDEGLGWSGQSSDGKLTYSVQKTFEEDGSKAKDSNGNIS